MGLDSLVIKRWSYWVQQFKLEFRQGNKKKFVVESHLNEKITWLIYLINIFNLFKVIAAHYVEVSDTPKGGHKSGYS